MAEQIIQLAWIVVHGWESNVTFFKIVNLEGIPGANENPDTDIKFSFQNKQRIFYVFLSNPWFLSPRWLLILYLGIQIKNLLTIGILHERQTSILADLWVIIEYFDFSSSTQPSWLYNPKILLTIHLALNKCLRIFYHQLFDELISIFPIGQFSFMLGF